MKQKGKKQTKPQLLMNGLLCLEGSKNILCDLEIIKTSNKKDTISKIKKNLEENIIKYKNEFAEKMLDLAIVVYIDNFRMKNQDVDNITKVVLDALKKTDDDDTYLFLDDSQIIRLLVYKILREELEGHETSAVVISFREHNPEEQMILVEKNEI